MGGKLGAGANHLIGTLSNPICTLYNRVAEVAQPAVTERSGSSSKGRTLNIRYVVVKLGIVAIYALFERQSNIHRVFNKSRPAFGELSMKVSLL